MDEFETNIQTFLNTIYGIEMRNSLGFCFRFIFDKLFEELDYKIKDLDNKIKKLEGGVQNGIIG